MKIGIPKEIKNNEFRVAITPIGVRELVKRGHQVCIQNSAGEGSSISDTEYQEAGAELVGSAKDVWLKNDLILKVKEPISQEYELLRSDQLLFTFLLYLDFILFSIRAKCNPGTYNEFIYLWFPGFHSFKDHAVTTVSISLICIFASISVFFISIAESTKAILAFSIFIGIPECTRSLSNTQIPTQGLLFTWGDTFFNYCISLMFMSHPNTKYTRHYTHYYRYKRTLGSSRRV